MTEVGSLSKKQLFIDTILRYWKIPKFYFVKTSSDPDEYEVVDGQQRLITIFEFFDNELPLSKTSAKLFGAEYYKDLREKYSDHFDDYALPAARSSIRFIANFVTLQDTWQNIHFSKRRFL